MTIMLDRLLSHLLRAVVMLLITATAGGTVFLLYSGLIHLCSGQFLAALGLLGACPLPSAGCYALSRHGNDLMDR
jgi:hypothetical protein